MNLSLFYNINNVVPTEFFKFTKTLKVIELLRKSCSCNFVPKIKKVLVPNSWKICGVLVVKVIKSHRIVDGSLRTLSKG